jgi:hypothetical protein
MLFTDGRIALLGVLTCSLHCDCFRCCRHCSFGLADDAELGSNDEHDHGSFQRHDGRSLMKSNVREKVANEKEIGVWVMKTDDEGEVEALHSATAFRPDGCLLWFQGLLAPHVNLLDSDTSHHCIPWNIHNAH